MRLFLSRVRRAFLLDAEVFEEVEHDHEATPQALVVVLVAGACGGLGNLLAAALLPGRTAAWASLLVVTAGFLVGWLAWSFLTMAVGTLLYGGVADMGEMQRALGLAAAPAILLLLPGVGLALAIPWSFVAMVLAVRQALDFTTRRAIATVATSAAVATLVIAPAACAIGAAPGLPSAPG